MNYLSLFSGIGAPEKALQNLCINYNLVAYCEIDKYASKSYAAIHNVDESKNLGDITKVDTSKLPTGIDLVTYGFPCQDISASGKLKGFYNKENGERTRSGLFFEALRIIEDLKPKYAIAENVKNLTSKRFKEEFTTVLNSLEEAGYNNYWKILDAQDFGMPQHRERVFIVSIRKDIDKTYTFPCGSELNKTIENYIENKVDDKYYLSETQLRYILDCDNVAFKSGRNINNRIVNPKIAKTISCRGAKDQRCDITNFVIENLKEEITCKQFKALAYDEQNKNLELTAP